MTQNERLDFLINHLISEDNRYSNIVIPKDSEEKFNLFRSLVNVREPKQISNEFIKLQDDYLQERLTEINITDAYDLQAISNKLYLWQGDITTLKCGAIVNAANSAMLGCFVPCHKCIDNAIHTFAGIQLRLECDNLMKQQGHEEQTGHFWHIKYPIVGTERFLEIATTRPETLLGDTAIAVHPDDDRYKDIVGKNVILPLVGREIPIVADAYVDKEFGTGAVKITPAHDPNDFEVGKRHNLPEINILNDDATIVEGYGRYSGMDRYEARKAIVEDLEKEGYLVSIEEHVHNVGTHDRCKTTVEPMIKPQWFVKMDELMEELERDRLNAIEKYTEIYHKIKLVEDEREQEILTYRYLLGESWEVICGIMGLKWTHTHRIHAKALKNFKMV